MTTTDRHDSDPWAWVSRSGQPVGSAGRLAELTEKLIRQKNSMLVFIVTDPNCQIIGAFSTIQAAARAVRGHPGAELQHLHLDGDDSLPADPQLFCS